jgi:hypothetical protein
METITSTVTMAKISYPFCDGENWMFEGSFFVDSKGDVCVKRKFSRNWHNYE